jgi:8-oxo-dGTP pyrophosphatase MutT (NUDIX family)
LQDQIEHQLEFPDHCRERDAVQNKCQIHYYVSERIREAQDQLPMAKANRPLQEAAVLVPHYRGEDEEARLVLVRRTEWGIHGGQIAFPGGKHSPEDLSLADTALRETREEIGLGSERIEIIEELPIVETMTSGFRIYPFLARITRPDSWHPDGREIAEILEVRVGELARPEAHGEETWKLPRRRGPERIAFFRVGDYQLWGATYRILSPLLPRLMAGEWSI